VASTTSIAAMRKGRLGSRCSTAAPGSSAAASISQSERVTRSF
jgi:hypothetical protein